MHLWVITGGRDTYIQRRFLNTLAFFSMRIPVVNSIKVIEHLYRTGEEPILVVCSDLKAYICKYMRSSSAAYKLVCEFIGAQIHL